MSELDHARAQLAYDIANGFVPPVPRRLHPPDRVRDPVPPLEDVEEPVGFEEEPADWEDESEPNGGRVSLAPRTSWTAAELMGIEFPKVRWAVDGIVAEGLSLLAGAPKLGKSWLALNLAVAVASGGKAFGTIDVVEGDVLYLALEDTGRRLQQRLRMVLDGAPAPERLTLSTVCEPLSAGGANRIDAWLDRNPDARLVIVDVFTRVRGRVNDKANRYDADYSAVAELKRIADEHQVAIILIHHTRKQEAGDYLDSVSGTQGLAGAADSVMVLTRSRGAAGAVLKVTGRDVEEAEHALDFDAATGTWNLLQGEAGDFELADTRRRIVQLLRDAEGLNPKAIADALDLKENTVRQTVRRMVDADQLDTDGEGHYFPPSHLSPQSPVTPSSDRSDRSDRDA